MLTNATIIRLTDTFGVQTPCNVRANLSAPTMRDQGDLPAADPPTGRLLVDAPLLDPSGSPGNIPVPKVGWTVKVKPDGYPGPELGYTVKLVRFEAGPLPHHVFLIKLG